MYVSVVEIIFFIQQSNNLKIYDYFRETIVDFLMNIQGIITRGGVNRLAHKGNSNHNERSKIIEDFIEVFGLEKIKVLVADREFTGKEWFKWLKENQIPLVQRVMKDHQIQTGKGRVAVTSIFSHLAMGEHTIYAKKKNTLWL